MLGVSKQLGAVIWKRYGLKLAVIPNYYISSFGRVRGKSGKILKGGKDTKGYPHVCIYDENGKQRTPKVHRLVAENLIQNLENKPQVNHIDANKENNRMENLEWVSGAENHAHKMMMGLNVNRRGSSHGRAKLSEEDAIEIYLDGRSRKELAEEFGVSLATVHSIKGGRNWSHITEGLK